MKENLIPRRGILHEHVKDAPDDVQNVPNSIADREFRADAQPGHESVAQSCMHDSYSGHIVA